MASDNVVLIGMPGAGKSTIGVVLAKVLGYDFLDGDLLIQKQTGKTLQRLIDDFGPLGFIEIEGEVLHDISAEKTVISPGGSAIYSDVGMSHLQQLGTIVYLEISYESLVERLGDLHERGVVLKEGIGTDLKKLYDERKPSYEYYADITVNVDGLSITQAARTVENLLNSPEE
ncbi:MAG: shikimate kinase [Eggerthellaceae bacterium]|jgi:shikimate kinase